MNAGFINKFQVMLNLTRFPSLTPLEESLKRNWTAKSNQNRISDAPNSNSRKIYLIGRLWFTRFQPKTHQLNHEIVKCCVYIDDHKWKMNLSLQNCSCLARWRIQFSAQWDKCWCFCNFSHLSQFFILEWIQSQLFAFRPTESGLDHSDLVFLIISELIIWKFRSIEGETMNKLEINSKFNHQNKDLTKVMVVIEKLAVIVVLSRNMSDRGQGWLMMIAFLQCNPKSRSWQSSILLQKPYYSMFAPFSIAFIESKIDQNLENCWNWVKRVYILCLTRLD